MPASVIGVSSGVSIVTQVCARLGACSGDEVQQIVIFSPSKFSIGEGAVCISESAKQNNGQTVPALKIILKFVVCPALMKAIRSGLEK